MKWLKNEEELMQYLQDMKSENKIANLDNYISWTKKKNIKINILYENIDNNKKILFSIPDEEKLFIL